MNARDALQGRNFKKVTLSHVTCHREAEGDKNWDRGKRNG